MNHLDGVKEDFQHATYSKFSPPPDDVIYSPITIADSCDVLTTTLKPLLHQQGAIERGYVHLDMHRLEILLEHIDNIRSLTQ